MSRLRIVPHGPERLFGVAVHQPDPFDSRVLATMPVGPGLLGADGRLAVGALGVIVDNVLGYSLIASLPPNSWTISTEIWIDLRGPLPAGATSLEVEASTLWTGSLATGTVRSSTGEVVALCRERGRQIPADGVTPLPDRTFDPVPQGSHDPLADFMESGDLGLRLGLQTDADELGFEVTESLVNPRRMLHGGISLAVAELAATRSRVQSGSTLATSSLHVVHNRPVPLGARIEVGTTTRHAGRSLWITEVDGRCGGRSAFLATVSAEAPPTHD